MYLGKVFFQKHLQTVTIYALALATLGDVTQIGLVLLVSCFLAVTLVVHDLTPWAAWQQTETVLLVIATP